MKFDYQEQTMKIAEFKLVKFKNGQNATKEGVILSLEKDKENPTTPIFFILRN